MVLLELNLDGGIFFGRNSFSNNADYDKEFMYVFFCFTLLRCDLVITTVVLEGVVQLELKLKHGDFSGGN